MVESTYRSSDAPLMPPEFDRPLNLAVISCGGTIAMEHGESGTLEPKKSVDDILGALNLSNLEGRVNISDKRELFKLDSTDLNQYDWIELNRVIQELQERSDGILVFHGTDTMAYSATATGLALAQSIKVPIMFTGAQSPIGETGSDARSNVERALLVLDKAARDGVKECMLFFGDEAYRGVNARKRSEADFRGFESPSVRPLYVTDGMGVRSTWPARTERDVREAQEKIGVHLRNDFAKGVVPFSAVPGLEADALMSQAERPGTRAIIINSLGVGNIPSRQGAAEFDLIPAIRAITDLGKFVIVTSPFVGGDTNMEVYLPGARAKEAGAIDSGRMTAEATLVKTRLILAQPEFTESPEAFRKALTTDFAGERGSL